MGEFDGRAESTRGDLGGVSVLLLDLAPGDEGGLQEEVAVLKFGAGGLMGDGCLCGRDMSGTGLLSRARGFLRTSVWND